MARDPNAYLEMLLGLLPTGPAWTRERYSVLVRFLSVFASALAAADARAADLHEEADPRAVPQMLDLWESVAGLPDTCSGALAARQDRRAALVQKITSLGGASRSYFLGIARTLGYDPVIQEYRPFIAGSGRCSRDSLMGGHAVRHYWSVTIYGPRTTWFRSGTSRCGERLMSITRAEDLECVLGRLKPAHTHLIFAYRDNTGQVPMSESGQIPMSESGQIPMAG